MPTLLYGRISDVITPHAWERKWHFCRPPTSIRNPGKTSMKEKDENPEWRPGCIVPDDETEFDRIPTWMWALVFILVALLLLTYAGLLLSQLTASSARKRVKTKSKSVERRATVSRRSSTGSESTSSSPATTAPFIRRPPGIRSPVFDCSSRSGTINSHLVAVCPGFFMRDQACQTDGAAAVADSARSHPTHESVPRGEDDRRRAEPDDEQTSLESSLSIDTPGTMTLNKSGNMKSTGISTQSFNSSFTLESDRDFVSHLTATGLYGKAGEPLENSLPRRVPNVPGFRVVEQPRSNFSSFQQSSRLTPGVLRPSQNRYRYSITEEDGFLFHEIHFPGMVTDKSGRPTPPVIVSPHLASESEGESVFTGASYSDVFGDVEPRTANVPDGASATGEPHRIPLQPMFKWDYSPIRWGIASQGGSGERRQRKKVIEIEC